MPLQVFYGLPSDFNGIISANYLPFNIGQSARIIMDVHYSDTLSQLYSFSPEQRGCYFRYERNLTLFKYYTEKNCFIDCASHRVATICNCTNFYMPRMPLVRVCQVSDEPCFEYVYAQLELNMASRAECSCLPSCTTLEYNMDTLYYRILSVLQKNATMEWYTTRLRFFAKSSTTTPIIKKELISDLQLIASIGGILSLFLGISLISIIEIIYYCLINSIKIYYQCRTIHQTDAIILDVDEPFYITNGRKINFP